MKIRETVDRVDEDPTINIIPLNGIDTSEELRKELLELQLKMATCSINHEYARVEFDDVFDMERKDELLAFMHDCRTQYLEARQALATYDPYALADFEKDLMRQKLSTVTCYNA